MDIGSNKGYGLFQMLDTLLPELRLTPARLFMVLSQVILGMLSPSRNSIRLRGGWLAVAAFPSPLHSHFPPTHPLTHTNLMMGIRQFASSNALSNSGLRSMATASCLKI